MNLIQKCNCCIKEDVCNIKEKYEQRVEEIKKYTDTDVEVSIKCNKFASASNVKGLRSDV